MTDGWPVQPDSRSCGPTSVAVAQWIARPGSPAPSREQVLALHRRLTRPRDSRGRWQVPWPRSLGTPPWAVARELGGRVRWVRRRGGERAVGAGLRLPAPVYVGSRWLPRHVVLVVDEVGETLRVYDPARGSVVDVDRSAFAAHRLGLSGWDVPWWVVTPGEPAGRGAAGPPAGRPGR